MVTFPYWTAKPEKAQTLQDRLWNLALASGFVGTILAMASATIALAPYLR
jgi:hypothetical protein